MCRDIFVFFFDNKPQLLQRVRTAGNAERWNSQSDDDSIRPSVHPSVRLPVRYSVTLRYCVQANEDTIVRFSASGRTILLVSGEVKFTQIFAGDHPQWGR